MRYTLLITFILNCLLSFAQHSLKGRLVNDTIPVPFAKLTLGSIQTRSDIDGYFELNNIQKGENILTIYSPEIGQITKPLQIPTKNITINISEFTQKFEEIVVTGGMKEVSRKQSIVNVEVYSGNFFQKNPSPSLYDALQMVNGVRPQLNCNICNTGDIHINGLEGPNTMILIDGMPIVSSLSTVYGLSGIPSALIERMEIVKGPASALYGSEAIGGVINVITKTPERSPRVYGDLRSNTWLETSADIGYKFNLGKKISVLNGINYFNYSIPMDRNNDGFTDITLQHRVSFFQKWNIKREENRLFSIAGRYLNEDRWGGQMNWNENFRGTDSIYGESIYTKRWELIATYQLPLKEKIFFNLSLNGHDQNSYYGDLSFMAKQNIAFSQLYLDKRWQHHDFLLGASFRYVYYDDNTTATSENKLNKPSKMSLPGIFIQDDILINNNNKLMLGARYDYHNLHGHILTPRFGYKWTPNDFSSIRLNTGTGFRVVNIFTEDHAALTGARDVIIADDISPESSYNINLTYSQDIRFERASLKFDITTFYTHFENKIIPDYDLNSNEINYYNIDGYAINKGVTFNTSMNLKSNLKFRLGGTFTDVYSIHESKKENQILTDRFSGSWVITYKLPRLFLSFDYTGKVHSPMRLPLLNSSDPRPEYSPWWSIQNIQINFNGLNNWELYCGVKNLLNWTPWRMGTNLIARSHDPFDKLVEFDHEGNPVATEENPNALTFDPSYVFAPNQGIRFFAGVRFTLQ